MEYQGCSAFAMEVHQHLLLPADASWYWRSSQDNASSLISLGHLKPSVQFCFPHCHHYLLHLSSGAAVVLGSGVTEDMMLAAWETSQRQLSSYCLSWQPCHMGKSGAENSEWVCKTVGRWELRARTPAKRSGKSVNAVCEASLGMRHPLVGQVLTCTSQYLNLPDYISQPSLQLEVTLWLFSGQWNPNRVMWVNSRLDWEKISHL